MSRLVRSPEIAELKAFSAAADLGTLGRAARLLGTSQPAISKRIRNLERVLGLELLLRSRDGVELTRSGEHFYELTREVLEGIEALEELALSPGHGDHPIRVAVSPTISEAVLPMFLAGYEPPGNTHLSLELTVANSTTIRELVREGKADLGIAASLPEESSGELEATELLDDEIVLAVPPVHAWTRYEQVPLRSFLATSLIMRDPGAHSRRTVERTLAETGRELAPPLIEVGSTKAAKDAARAHNVPALLSSLVLGAEDSDLQRRRVSEVSFRRTFVVLCAAREALDPSARHFLTYVEEHAQTR